MGVYERDYMRRTHGAAQHSNVHRGRFGILQARRATGSWSTWIAWITAFVVAIVGLKYVVEQRDAQPFPESGTAHWYTSSQEPRIAQLMLAAPAVTRNHFAVRLDDWSTGAPVVLIHVRGGESSATLLPLGRYRVTIIKGSRWFGAGRLFGMGAEVREAVDPLDFYQREQRVMGHRIELETLTGNMATQQGRR